VRKSTAAILTALASLGLTAAALATAPQPASAATAAYQLTYATLPNGAKVPVRWNGCQTAITYKVNLASVPSAQRSTFLSETHATIRQLATATGFRFAYKGQTAEVPRVGSTATQTAELVIAYATPSKTNFNLSGNVLGVGGLSYYWSSRTVSGKTTYTVAAQRGWVVIDTPDTLRLTRAGFGTGTRRTNLLLHELGHAVGLQHVGDVRQQMYPTLSSRSPQGFASTGDRVGLQKIGRGAGCIDTRYLPLADLS
jgi:matrixin